MIRTAFAAMLVLASCTTDNHLGDVPGTLFGAAVQSTTSGDANQESAFTAVEQESGRRFDLDRIYHQWDDAAPGARETWTIQQGRTPIVSFNTKSSTSITWSAIAGGAEDESLGVVADSFRALGVRTFCIFDQEPENNASQAGSPDDYRAAYRHIVTIFREHQVTNVVWIFNMKSPSFPQLADQYYPGDDVVDWIGTSAYNYGVGTSGGRWVSFADLIADFVTWATPHGKPLIVSEWASDEDPSDATRKATWITQALGALKTTPQIRAASAFWDETDGNRFDSSPAALAAFRAVAADPYVNLRAVTP